MILRNHRLLIVGRTVAESFYLVYYLDQACRIQASAQATGVRFSMPSMETQKRTRAQSVDSPIQGRRPGRRCDASWTGNSRTTGRDQPWRNQ